MRKPVYRTIGRCVGISLSATFLAASAVSLRHILETPQPLKSSLPGESRLYTWQRHSLFYKVAGDPDASPLVLLHNPAIGASAHEMQQIMQPLASFYRVYALDLLGFGLSDHPDIPYSAELYTTLCHDFLRDVVQQPAVLVASGLSANYAVSVASRSPEKCLALVLLSPIALYGEPSRWLWLKEMAQLPVFKVFLYTLLSTKLVFRLTHDQAPGRQNWPLFYATTHQLGAEYAAMALLAGQLGGSAARQLQQISQPVLMIWGTQALENQRNLARLQERTSSPASARQIREVELIQDAGLDVHEEQANSVITAIQRWLPAIARKPARVASDAVEPAPATPVEMPPTALAQATVSAPETETTAQTPGEPGAIPTIDAEPGVTQASSISQEQSNPAPVSTPTEQKLLAYCMKCKQKTEMQNVQEFTMKNGRKAVRGTCAICGTNIHRIGGIS